MTSISKKVDIDKLDEIINKYNNTDHRTIKMEPVDVNPSMYINLDKENNKEGCKFKISDIVRISKYKNIFVKRYVPNWSEEVFILKKLKALCCGHMLLLILTEKKLLERFTKKIAKNKSKRV